MAGPYTAYWHVRMQTLSIAFCVEVCTSSRFLPGSFWGNIQIFNNWEMLEEGYYPDVFTETEEPFSGRNSSVLWEVIPNLR